MIKFNSPKELAEALDSNISLRPVAEDMLRACINVVQETARDFQPLPLGWYALCNSSLPAFENPLISEALCLIQTLIDRLEDNGFESWFGGAIFVCENEEDLKQIEGMSFDFADANGRWPNITEDASIGQWDICEYIGEPPTYCVVCLCSNNAGGNVYYVPSSLFKAARIEEHIKEYSELWK